MKIFLTITSAAITRNLRGIIHYLLIAAESGGWGGGAQECGVKGGVDQGIQGGVQGFLTAGHGKRQVSRRSGFFQEPSHSNPNIEGKGHKESSKGALCWKG